MNLLSKKKKTSQQYLLEGRVSFMFRRAYSLRLISAMEEPLSLSEAYKKCPEIKNETTLKQLHFFVKTGLAIKAQSAESKHYFQLTEKGVKLKKLISQIIEIEKTA